MAINQYPGERRIGFDWREAVNIRRACANRHGGTFTVQQLYAFVADTFGHFPDQHDQTLVSPQHACPDVQSGELVGLGDGVWRNVVHLGGDPVPVPRGAVKRTGRKLLGGAPAHIRPFTGIIDELETRLESVHERRDRAIAAGKATDGFDRAISKITRELTAAREVVAPWIAVV